MEEQREQRRRALKDEKREAKKEVRGGEQRR